MEVLARSFPMAPAALSRISCVCKTRGRLLREMLRRSRRSPMKRCKRSTFDVRGRLDRNLEVAGSDPASGIEAAAKRRFSCEEAAPGYFQALGCLDEFRRARDVCLGG